jgi:hypothetical protein
MQIADGLAIKGEIPRTSDRMISWMQQIDGLRVLAVSLERARKQRDAGLPEIRTDPLLENLRHDRRYVEFLEKMRLPT